MIVGVYLFTSIQIQTIQNCNLRCKFCPNSYMEQTNNKMSMDTYKKIIDELESIEYTGRVSPYLMNEPLLDDRFNDIITYTKKKLPTAVIRAKIPL